MFKYFAKKWILSQLNSLLKNLKNNEKVDFWKNKINLILYFLQKVMKALEDNAITGEESDELIVEAKKLF